MKFNGIILLVILLLLSYPEKFMNIPVLGEYIKKYIMSSSSSITPGVTNLNIAPNASNPTVTAP